MDTHDEIPLSLLKNPKFTATLVILKQANPEAYCTFLKNHARIEQQHEPLLKYFDVRMHDIYNHFALVQSFLEKFFILRDRAENILGRGIEELDELSRRDKEEVKSLVRQFNQQNL